MRHQLVRLVLATYFIALYVCIIAAPADNEDDNPQDQVTTEPPESQRDCNNDGPVSKREAELIDIAIKLNKLSENLTSEESDLLDDLLNDSCDDEKDEDKSRQKRSNYCEIKCPKGNCNASGNRCKCKCSWWSGKPKCKCRSSWWGKK